MMQTRLGGNVSSQSGQEEMAQALQHSTVRVLTLATHEGAMVQLADQDPAVLVAVGVLGHPYKQKPSVKNFIKKVILVEPEAFVPKGWKRQQACDEGWVVDVMEFHSDWTEMQTISTIEDVFSSVLASGPSQKSIT